MKTKEEKARKGKRANVRGTNFFTLNDLYVFYSD